MEICNKILHSYAIYCRKEMVKILKCYLIPKKSYDTLSKGAIFFGQPCISEIYLFCGLVLLYIRVYFVMYISHNFIVNKLKKVVLQNK